MKNDNQKDARILTSREADTVALTAEPSPIRRELTDDETATVVGGLSPLPLPGPPKMRNPI